MKHFVMVVGCSLIMCGSAVAAPQVNNIAIPQSKNVQAAVQPGGVVKGSSQDQIRPVSGISMKDALDYYFKALPPEASRQEVLASMPPQIRDRISGKLSVAFFRRHIGNALERSFTPAEIYAMAQFYGSAEGRSVMKKYPVFMKEIVEPVRKEVFVMMEAIKKQGVDANGPQMTPVPQR